MSFANARLAAVAAVAALAACGTPLPPASSPAPAPAPEALRPAARPPAPGGAAYEQRVRERALGQGRQGRLAEAMLSWEILTVLRPESAEYRDRLAETRRLADATFADRLERGAQALRRHDLDAAAAHYLTALSLQPDHAGAADALRGIERERNRRMHLGKPSRLTLTRRAATEAQMNALAPAVPLDRNEIEHAALLGTQGEHDEAIALLERLLAKDRRDASACRLLAEMYVQKGEKQLARDRVAAQLAFEKGLRIDAGNLQAAARLRQLKGPAAGRGAPPATTLLPIAAGGAAEPCGGR